MVIIGARLAVIGQQRIACDNRVADDRIVQRKLLADVQPQQRNTAGKVVADIGLYIGENVPSSTVSTLGTGKTASLRFS